MRLRAELNDLLRLLTGAVVRATGALFAMRERVRIRFHARAQGALRARYGVTNETPISRYDDALRAHLEDLARRRGARLAETSGSSATPKRLVYTRARVRAVKAVFVDVFCRLASARRLPRTSLYVFSALASDTSLTSLMMQERGVPGRLALLQAPYRAHGAPELKALATRYGHAAARLFVLALSDPGVLYATNPSTLQAFFDQLTSEWTRTTALARAFVERPGDFPRAVHQLARRLESYGARERLRTIAASELPLPFRAIAPSCRTFITWDGGYVAPFLARVRDVLPREHCLHVPMYSMSTETVETVTTFTGDDVAFLPLGPGVLYELLPEDVHDDPAQLIPAARAEAGRCYTLVVSDDHGLVRYQTDDVFACTRRVHGLPDLRFVGRRGAEYSFTGEKLTSAQVELAIAMVREELPELGNDFIAVVPSQPDDERVPHYRCVWLARPGAPVLSLARLAERLDALLAAANGEYASKVMSGRLKPVRARAMSIESFARHVGAERHGETWETQMKFLPLYRRTWESYGKSTGQRAS